MTTYTKQELVDWMIDLQNNLIDCDPSRDLDAFIDIQEEQDALVQAITRSGFEFDEIETQFLLDY